MVTIRPYALADRATVERFLVDFQNYERNFVPEMLPGDEIASPYLDYLLTNCEANNGWLMIAEIGGVPVGYTAYWIDVDEDQFCMSYPSVLTVSDLYVTPECRGNGVGKALLESAERYGRGLAQPCLSLTVLAASKDSRAFYRKVGFIEQNVIMTRTI